MLVWLFRLALNLYPVGFRREYRGEMIQVFKDSLQAARSNEGALGPFRVFLRSLLDVFMSAPKEQWSADWASISLWIVAIPLGWAIGYIDSHSSEVQVAVAFLLAASFVFGLARPNRAWRWAFAVGVCIPGYYVGATLLGVHLPPVEPNLFATCIAFIPATIGAYVGAGFNRVLTTSL